MAKQIAIENKPGPVQRIKTFFDEVRTEMRKVTWPTKSDLYVSTQVTILLITALVIIILLYDKVFSSVLLFLLKMAS